MNYTITYACDYCGTVTKVAHTHYGTTHYTRLICKECHDYANANALKNLGIENYIEKNDIAFKKNIKEVKEWNQKTRS